MAKKKPTMEAGDDLETVDVETADAETQTTEADHRRAVGIRQRDPLSPDETVDPAPGTDEHVELGGTFPSVSRATPTHEGAYWPTPQAMLDALAQHARTTHGLAADKEMMVKVHAYLTYHLTANDFISDPHDNA